MNDEDRRARRACEHFLTHHRPASPADVLRRLSDHPAASEEADRYGAGGAVAALEKRTAALLSKPAALFFIKGVIAQLCVLRVHQESRSTSNVAIHPLSHLDLDEAHAIERVGGARAIRIGRFAPFGLAELEALTEPLAAVVVELPLRRAGYRLPDLEELRAIAHWCRQHEVPLHFDGARLWEAAAGYGLPLAELAALADSIYVSFYKGLGGLGGAMVVGSDTLIRSLRVWKTRHGGDLYTAFPYAISALEGLDRHLPLMAKYTERARSLAARLTEQGQAIVNPSRPDVNAFQLVMKGAPAELAARNRAFAKARHIWLFNALVEAPLQGHAIGEIVIGGASETYTDEEASSWIADFLSF